MMPMHWIGLSMAPLWVALIPFLSEPSQAAGGGHDSPTWQTNQVSVVPGMMVAFPATQWRARKGSTAVLLTPFPPPSPARCVRVNKSNVPSENIKERLGSPILEVTNACDDLGGGQKKAGSAPFFGAH